jgi:hypothetical protein
VPLNRPLASSQAHLWTAKGSYPNSAPQTNKVLVFTGSIYPWSRLKNYSYKNEYLIQSNLDITILDIAISSQANDMPLVPPLFCSILTTSSLITIIVSILGPKVRIYTRYRYIYTDLCLLMLTYLTYADHMRIIARNLAGFCGN